MYTMLQIIHFNTMAFLKIAKKIVNHFKHATVILEKVSLTFNIAA